MRKYFLDKSFCLMIKLMLIALVVSFLSELRSSELPDIQSREMLDAIARVESQCGNKKFLVGDDFKSFGKFQIQVATANGLGFNINKNDLMNDFINETVARAYLLYLQDKLGGNKERILMAYNCGEGKAKKIKHIRCVKTKTKRSCGCSLVEIKKALTNPCPV